MLLRCCDGFAFPNKLLATLWFDSFFILGLRGHGERMCTVPKEGGERQSCF